MRNSVLAALASVLVLGCGGGDEAPNAESSPVVLDGRTSAVATPAPHDHVSHGKHDGKHGKKSAELPRWVGGPGTLTVVYSNNVDGEIEPCG